MDNQKNNFSENNFELNKNSELDMLFKKALQNHAVPAEDHVWRRIQHGLSDKKGETQMPSAKRSYLPIWSAVSGIAASLLIWTIFFAPVAQNDETHSTALAKAEKVEPIKESNKEQNQFANLAAQEIVSPNQTTDATSSNQIASQEQIPPTITIKNTVSKHQTIKSHIDKNHIERAVASLEKDQTKIKNQQVKDKLNDKTFTNPSTYIAENVWASDFVVQNSDVSTLKRNQSNSATHQLNLDNQTVAITIKVGRNEGTSQATGFDANTTPSQLDKAKNVLKEVWNLKTGKKVNLQNILPNNENEKATEKTTTYQTTQNDEIQAD